MNNPLLGPLWISLSLVTPKQSTPPTRFATPMPMSRVAREFCRGSLVGSVIAVRFQEHFLNFVLSSICDKSPQKRKGCSAQRHVRQQSGQDNRRCPGRVGAALAFAGITYRLNNLSAFNAPAKYYTAIQTEALPRYSAA